MSSSRRIGNYQITDYIGSGGFGSVFKAEDVNTPGRVVAIKELHKKHTRNQVIKQRFFQEAVAMARLDHPNLPRLYTFGEDGGSYYLVMEFISGKLLSDEIHEKGPIRPDRAITIMSQVLEALSYAHRNGIIHRDLKPDNIILVGDGGSRVKVLDFGIARMVGGESLTLAGEGFGTPAYMSPERITGAGGDDPRMDLYSAGIMLFEMLAGKAPFQSTSSDPVLYWAEMRDLHQREPLPPLAPLGVPVELERVAMRATAKRVEDRFQAADEMLSELKGLSVTSADAPTVVLSGARLLLATAPGAAEVYVDDVLRGTSDAVRGKILIDGLSAGLHSVRVLKEGYNEYRINVALEEGRQTDLQVALPARATVAMPPADNTAAGGFETLKLQGADEIKTALLTIDSLPAGTTLFVGSEPVAQAAEDGRATLKLAPGAYEIRAAAPSGATASRVVNVTGEDAGAFKTMTLPLTQATGAAQSLPTHSAIVAGAAQPSKKGKQMAAAAVVILLLALAAAAYFALRGPDRRSTPVESATVSPAAAGEQAKTEPDTQNADQQTAEEKKKAAEAHRQAQQDAAAAEAEKKVNEAKNQEKAEKKESSSQPPAPAGAPQPPAVLPPTPGGGTIPGPNREACLIVSVTDPNGQPVSRARVAIIEQDSVSSPLRNGHTGDKGKMRECGLTAGRPVKVVAMGPRGMPLGSQTAVLNPGANFIEVRAQHSMDEQPERPNRNPLDRPNRKRPFFQRP